ncbi:MAG: CBS domain-containing protein [Oscillospiraceae bacterium]|nr:CBS domain-containing protein [Oscillospiraceae bacterium]
MQVKDIMTRDPVRIAPEETVSVAARMLGRGNIGALPVCTADGRLRGILTDRDIVLRSVAANEDAGQQSVRDIMSRRLVTVSGETAVGAAAEQMARQQVRRLPVVEGGKLVGMLSLSDLACRSGLHTETAQALEDISSNLRRSADQSP